MAIVIAETKDEMRTRVRGVAQTKVRGVATTIGRPCRKGMCDSLTVAVDVGAQAAVSRLLECLRYAQRLATLRGAAKLA